MPGASRKREKDSPLSLTARLALYTMLAGLVLASFTMVPERRAPATVAVTARIEGDRPALARPIDDYLHSDRVAPMARGLFLDLRGIDEPDPMASALETVDAEPAPPVAVAAAPEPLAEPAVETAPEPEPETMPVPESAPKPEPAPPPPPQAPPPAPPPVARAASWQTNATTQWAEGHMLELMNATRARAGLAPLVMDAAVANTARAHSAAETQVRYVYHDGPDGTSASRNVPACGTGWYGENTGKIWNDNVDALHIEFMAEPWVPINHRTNIMDPAFKRVGVGAVIGPDAMYMTMVFCR